MCDKQCDKLWCVVTADGESVPPPHYWRQAVTLFTVYSANVLRLYWYFQLKACGKFCWSSSGFLGNCWSLIKEVLTERRRVEWGLVSVTQKVLQGSLCCVCSMGDSHILLELAIAFNLSHKCNELSPNVLIIFCSNYFVKQWRPGNLSLPHCAPNMYLRQMHRIIIATHMGFCLLFWFCCKRFSLLPSSGHTVDSIWPSTH